MNWKRFNWEQWSIKSRLAFIMLFQVTLMFSLNALYSYYSRLNEAEQELQERGHLLVSLLAESSDYNVVTSNVEPLRRMIHGLIEADRSINSIEILDKNKNRLIKQSRKISDAVEKRFFEVPIKSQLAPVPSLADLTTPHLSSSPSDVPKIRAPVVGYVIVGMTPSAMISKQRQRILVQVIISTLVLLLSGGLTLVLAKSLIRPLTKTIEVVRHIRQGNYAIDIPIRTGGEIAELQLAVVEMANSLEAFKRELEEKVAIRTQELKAARDDAIQSNVEKRKLIQKINTALEEERRLISIEIHDQLNSTLIGIRLEAHQIIDSLKKHDHPDLDNLVSRANTIISLASGLYANARAIVRMLRPEVIDALGLSGAVEDMVINFDRLHRNCRFYYEEAGDLSDLDGDLSIGAYRIIQEALSNAIKHSDATIVKVILQALIRNKERILKITIDDNGKGFDSINIEPGIGLIGMRERVHGFGGQLEIQSNVGKGTKIVVELPFKKLIA